AQQKADPIAPGPARPRATGTIEHPVHAGAARRCAEGTPRPAACHRETRSRSGGDARTPASPQDVGPAPKDAARAGASKPRIVAVDGSSLDAAVPRGIESPPCVVDRRGVLPRPQTRTAHRPQAIKAHARSARVD